nr:MAG TPA: hypothetical protein [Caudoviricetes sp.]
MSRPTRACELKSDSPVWASPPKVTPYTGV